MKLIEKTRIGSRVKKKYDKARTPYKRVLESPYIAEHAKKKLKRQYAKLNPAELKRQITKLQNRLLKLASLKEMMRKQNLNVNKKNQSISGQYSDMVLSEKIACRASGEAGFPGLLLKSDSLANKCHNQTKKRKLFGVDFT